MGAAVAVLAAGGGIAVLNWPGEAVPAALPATIAAVPAAPAAAPAPAAQAQAPAVRTSIKEIGLSAPSLPQRATERFSMLSVSWQNPKDKPVGTVQVRTRDAASGGWSGWQSLAVAEAAADQSGEVAKVRGRTEPLWAGPSDGVAARLVGAGVKPLPAGLRLNLIDPDAAVTRGGTGGGAAMTPNPSPPPSQGPAPAPATGSTTAPPPTPEATKATPTPAATTKPAQPALVKPAAMPAVVSRAGWGADESLVKAPATVAPDGVKVVFVHHSGFKAVPCAQSASQIRSIMANDVNEGFDDIGYNFVVDSCGTVFEGRKGSVTKAVVGAHVAGFNTGSAGVALLGDYTTIKPTQIALTRIAQIAAARLAAYGSDASGTAELGGKTLPRMAGHRDADQTACPGNAMYPFMTVMRARALMPDLKLTGLTGGPLVGATGSYYVRTTARLSWSVGGDPAGIARFDILRNNQVVKTITGGTERATDIDVPAGANTFAVRVVHTTGAADVTPSIKVVGDRTAPIVAAGPTVTLRTGTSSATSVPATVTFRTTDNVKVFSQRATAPAVVPLGAASTVWYPTVKPGAALQYTVEARDWAGNVGSKSVSRTVTQLPETAAKKTGAWSARVASSYLGGRALAASARNAKLAYTFTGTSAALTFTRTPATGVASVYVDGVKVATVDTRAAKTTHRQTLWVRSLTRKAHTVSVVVAGTSGRPTVISDGLTYVR
ncbi:hypothetical protein Aab01nite_15560 [Paractinoplanes abujensis]|nr:hypothetical protein Aab01nite_15560 [Actinoplanes abujensis]